MKAILSLLFILCLSLQACHSSQQDRLPVVEQLTPQQKIDNAIDSLKAGALEGDLITHLNDDIVSGAIRNMNEKDFSFSHSGIIVIRDGQKMVCNIYPAVHPGTLTDTIQYQPIDSFLNPKTNLEAGLFRYDLSAQEKKNFIATLDSFKMTKAHFDELYDYTTNDKLYCSEMIAKSLEKATNGRYSFKKIFLTPAMVKLFMIYYKQKHYSEKRVSQVDYVSIDNLYNIPQCKEIMRTKLKYMP